MGEFLLICVKEWQETPYQQLDEYTERKNIKSISGLYVRSKTEAVIAGELYRHDIPFRYECALPVNTAVYYPDFLLLDPETGGLIPWEHFGMMDDMEYFIDYKRKMEEYEKAGIVPWDNLIVTYGKSNSGIDGRMIESMIKAWLL